jgi:hypothetical protein
LVILFKGDFIILSLNGIVRTYEFGDNFGISITPVLMSTFPEYGALGIG